jgi:hypothetical protein
MGRLERGGSLTDPCVSLIEASPKGVRPHFPRFAATCGRLVCDGGVAMDLSLEKPFRIGLADVTPATLRVAWNGHEETLQPRVMEVLLVLARAGGDVVSRLRSAVRTPPERSCCR